MLANRLCFQADLCIGCQLENGCHACGTLNCFGTKPECPFFERQVLNHVDASQTGESAPDIFDRSPVKFSEPDEHAGLVWLDFQFQNRAYQLFRGFATGNQNNCLIHTLQQAVSDQDIPCVADITWVRQRSQQRFPHP